MYRVPLGSPRSVARVLTLCCAYAARDRPPAPDLGVAMTQVRNAGWCWESVEPGAAGMPAGVSIRGYALRKEGGVQIELQEPGRYEVSGDGVVTRL